MSLRIWLPMTKDLRNQGLSNVTVTNNGATFNSAGKLGGCYSFSGSSQKIVNALPSTITSSVGSLSCWIKMNSLPGSSSFYNLLQLGSLGGYATCRLGLYMEYTNYINISIDGSSTGSNRYIHSMVTNQWYHICATYDGTIVKLYIDGNEVLSKTASKGSYTTAASYLYIGGTSSYYLNGYMNDARYYDHCLSPQEVKELSKGLILHYPLNRQGWGQENLLKGTRLLDGDTSVSSGVTKTANAYQGFTSATYNNSSSSSTHELIYWNKKIVVNANEVYIVSFYAKSPSSAEMYCYFYNNNTDIVQVVASPTSSSSTGAQVGSGDGSTRIKLSTNWKRYWVKWVFSNSSSAQKSLLFRCVARTGELSVCGVKLEKGSIATPWCPNSSDTLATTMGLNSTIEYDCSGFCNNGTRTGTFSWTSDTPKYNVSTKFSGTERIEANSLPSETKTITCWVNFFEVPSGYTIPIFDKNSKLAIGVSANARLITYIGTAAGGAGTQINTSFDTNKWYHIVAVKTGDNTRNVYINGELKPSSGGNWWGGDLDKLLIGCRHISGNYSSPFKGQLCDVRAYATALSADDVKSLYRNCATIDPDGTIRGKIR